MGVAPRPRLGALLPHLPRFPIDPLNLSFDHSAPRWDFVVALLFSPTKHRERGAGSKNKTSHILIHVFGHLSFSRPSSPIFEVDVDGVVDINGATEQLHEGTPQAQTSRCTRPPAYVLLLLLLLLLQTSLPLTR